MRKMSIRALLGISLALVACESFTEIPVATYRAALRGENVRPTAVPGAGSGAFSSSLSLSNILTYSLEFAGLADNSIAAHIHGPADTGSTANILVDFAALPGGSAGMIQLGSATGMGSGTLDLSGGITASVSGDSLRRLLDTGQAYVDVHTATAGTEIRGQIRRN